MPGFKKFVRKGIQVRFTDTVEVNIRIQVKDAPAVRREAPPELQTFTS